MKINLYSLIFYTWLISDILIFNEFITIARIGILLGAIIWLINKSTKIIISDFGIIGLIAYNIYSLFNTVDLLSSISLISNTLIFIILISHYNNEELSYSLIDDIDDLIKVFVPIQLISQILSIINPLLFSIHFTRIGSIYYSQGKSFDKELWDLVVPGLFRDTSYLSYIFLAFLVLRYIYKKKSNISSFDIYDFMILISLALANSNTAQLFLVLFLSIQIKLNLSYKKLKIVSLNFLIGILVILGIWINVPKLAMLTSTEFADLETFSFRKVNAFIALKMFQESPILGKGYGSFKETSLNYFPEQVLNTSYFGQLKKKGGLYSHNLLATSAGEGGIISLTTIIIYLIFTPYGLIFSRESLKSEYYFFDLLVLIIAIVYGHRLDTFILFFLDLIRRTKKNKLNQ